MHPKPTKSRRDFVLAFGGACSQCGYNRCIRALQFHHIDPATKGEWSNGLGRVSVAELIAHPEHFELLCANCHFERHESLDQANASYKHCEHCSKRFRVKPKQINDGRKRFCSKKCASEFQRIDPERSVRERLLSGIELKGGCWIWIRGSQYTGVPVMGRTVDGKMRPRSVRKIAWELYKASPIPDRIVPSCGNPGCVNPEHLIDYSEVTQPRLRGEQVPGSLLTTEQVQDIRLRASQGETLSSLAREYGVIRQTVSSIVHRKTWKHVN